MITPTEQKAITDAFVAALTKALARSAPPPATNTASLGDELRKHVEGLVAAAKPNVTAAAPPAAAPLQKVAPVAPTTAPAAATPDAATLQLDLIKAARTRPIPLLVGTPTRSGDAPGGGHAAWLERRAEQLAEVAKATHVEPAHAAADQRDADLAAHDCVAFDAIRKARSAPQSIDPFTLLNPDAAAPAPDQRAALRAEIALCREVGNLDDRIEMLQRQLAAAEFRIAYQNAPRRSLFGS